MAPPQDLYLRSYDLMVHDSWMPNGQRNALTKLSQPGGFGTTVQCGTLDNMFWNLGEHLTLKEVDFDFQLRDYRGATVRLLAPTSFQLIFDCQ